MMSWFAINYVVSALELNRSDNSRIRVQYDYVTAHCLVNLPPLYCKKNSSTLENVRIVFVVGGFVGLHMHLPLAWSISIDRSIPNSRSSFHKWNR